MSRRPRVFMMDLLATVPYYTAYLSKALLAEGVDVRVGSISYYLDAACFSSRGLRTDPGLMDVVGRFRMPRMPRRVLKMLEGVVNLTALSGRFAVSPPEIVHVQYLPMLTWRLPLDLWFLRMCRRRGAKVVLTVHDLMPHDTGETHKQAFYELYGMADRLICHSESVRSRLMAEFSVPESKLWVISHGPFFYDLAPAGEEALVRGFGVERDRVTVLWQGIIFPYKGIDLLLDAWGKVEAAAENADLQIVGTGAPEFLEQIQEQIARCGLKRVRLHPRFISPEELVALYRAAGVVVYPYRAITTSGALATGLALGSTIVASDLPVFRELLVDGESALLVDPQDGEALAGALIALAKDRDLRERLAGRVREMRFGDASWKGIAEKTFACYESL